MFKSKSTHASEVAPVKPEAKAKRIPFVSLIGPSFASVGNIVLKGNLRIDGEHHGNVLKSAEMQEELVVYVGPGGYIKGEVHADLIIIDGTVDGIAKTNGDLHIRQSGKLIGKGFYRSYIKVDGDIEGEVKKFSTLAGDQRLHQPDTMPNNVTPLGPKRDVSP